MWTFTLPCLCYAVRIGGAPPNGSETFTFPCLCCPVHGVFSHLWLENRGLRDAGAEW